MRFWKSWCAVRVRLMPALAIFCYSCFATEDISCHSIAKLVVMSFSIRIEQTHIGSFFWRNTQLIQRFQDERGKPSLTRQGKEITAVATIRSPILPQQRTSGGYSLGLSSPQNRKNDASALRLLSFHNYQAIRRRPVWCSFVQHIPNLRIINFFYIINSHL